ncbi:MAG: nicotinate (nicotinamide) nucleotide adenylyltransferase [Planctomycetota bacterium]|jgi:nicotinate-nucleotide adenylyltransferase
MTGAPRILVYGGTFDPPHRAHVELPRTVLRELPADAILYVPTSLNPLKSERPTSAADRLAMLSIALADFPEASVSEIEINATAASYTVDTLERLAASELANADRYLLVGADAVADIDRWKRWTDIADLATPVIMLRPPWTDASIRAHLVERLGPEAAADWTRHILNPGPLDIVATELRDRLAAGEIPDGELPPGIADYIRRQDLYGD